MIRSQFMSERTVYQFWSRIFSLAVLITIATGSMSMAQVEPGLLRAASPVPATALGNPYVRDDGTSIRVALFDALTRLTRDAKLKPALAKSWKSAGPNTWIFELREDVVFHNGAPLRADDVVANFEFLKSPDAAQFTIARHAETISVAEAVNPLTVVFTTHDPDPILPNRLANVTIVEPRVWSELGADGFTQEPVGTGPFTPVDWGAAGREVELAAFSRSWRKSQSVERVRIVVLPDSTTRLQALLSGQVDIAVNLDPDAIPELEAAGLKVLVLPAAHIVTLALRNTGNVSDGLKNKLVRQAINYAVNKEIMAEQLLSGHVRVVSQPATPEVFGFNPSLEPYPYDPEKARSLLAAAGYGDGLALTFGVVPGQTPADALLFQLIQQDLANVGIDVTLRLLSFLDLARRITSGEWDNIDAYSGTLSSAWFGDAGQAIDRLSCDYPATFFCEPSMTDLIERSEHEMDRAKREALLHEIMAKFHDLAPVLYLVDYSSLTATLPRVRSYSARATGMEFENIILSE